MDHQHNAFEQVWIIPQCNAVMLCFHCHQHKCYISYTYIRIKIVYFLCDDLMLGIHICQSEILEINFLNCHKLSYVSMGKYKHAKDNTAITYVSVLNVPCQVR